MFARVVLEQLIRPNQLRLGRYRVDYSALDEDEKEYTGVAWMLVSRNTKVGQEPMSSGAFRLTLFSGGMAALVHFDLSEGELDLDTWARSEPGDDPFRDELQDYVDPNIQGYEFTPVGPGVVPVPSVT